MSTKSFLNYFRSGFKMKNICTESWKAGNKNGQCSVRGQSGWRWFSWGCQKENHTQIGNLMFIMPMERATVFFHLLHCCSQRLQDRMENLPSDS